MGKEKFLPNEQFDDVVNAKHLVNEHDSYAKSSLAFRFLLFFFIDMFERRKAASFFSLLISK